MDTKETILVVGMHKSGTSMLANILELLGIYFGEEKNKIPSQYDNVFGFNELEEVIKINDKILDDNNLSWHTPITNQEITATEDEKYHIEKLIENLYKSSTRIGIKDPRISRLIPLWNSVIKNAKFILIYRNPLEIVESLKKRNDFDEEKILKLWKEHNDIPLKTIPKKDLYVISYEEICNNPINQVLKLSEYLNIPIDDQKMREISYIVQKGLRHSKIKKEDFLDNPKYSAEYKNTFRKLEQAKENIQSSINAKDIDLNKDNEAEIKFLKNQILKLDKLIWENVVEHKEVVKQLQIEKGNSKALHKELKKNQKKLSSKEAEIKSLKDTLSRRSVRLIIFIANRFRDIQYIAKKIVRKLITLISNEPNVQQQIITYDQWIKDIESKRYDLIDFENEINKFNTKPLISIIIPVYKVESKLLEKAIESVIYQSYKNWEIIIVDDYSKSEPINKLLKKYSKDYNNITTIFSEKNIGISEASNIGIKNSKGTYIGFLDHDDEITPNALYEVVKAINENSKLKFIYSDEDKLDENGERVEPLFKPEWSPETFDSLMYTSHFRVFEKEIVEKVGLHDKKFDGSQDYDLILKVTEKLNSDEIHRIPQILYHWRKIEGSTSATYDNKSYANIAAKKALESSLKRRNLEATVEEGLTPPSFRIKYKIINNPKINIIIPFKNEYKLIEKLIKSIQLKTIYKNYQITIVDNNSDDKETLEYLKRLPKEVNLLEYKKPFNYSAINNFAVSQSDGDYLLFLNNDVEIINEGWLSSMLEFAQRKEIAAVGAKLYYPDNTVQHAGIILGINGVAGHSHKFLNRDDSGYMDRLKIISNVSAVTGACLLVSRSKFEEVGGFNDKYLTVAFNDVDLCLKFLSKGYRNVYTPFAELYHYESKSRGKDNTPEKISRFAKEIDYMKDTWGELLENDPYYNPNLCMVSEDFRISNK